MLIRSLDQHEQFPAHCMIMHKACQSAIQQQLPAIAYKASASESICEVHRPFKQHFAFPLFTVRIPKVSGEDHHDSNN
jgi:hypothetical protein